MNANDILKYGHQTLLDAMDGINADEVETSGVCGIWSVRNVIAHLASFEEALVDLLTSMVSPTPVATPVLDAMLADYDGFNDSQVLAREGMSWTETWQSYLAAYERVATLITQVPIETQRTKGAIEWYGPDYDVEDFLVYTYYGHKREHSAQLEVFKTNR